MASSFQEFAEKFRAEAERAIKAELSKSLLGSIVFGRFTPLTVNIDTDQGVASLTILQDGTVRLNQGLSLNPDNTIHAHFETLEDIYYKRDRIQFTKAEADGRIKITSHNSKGQQVERKLRELLGSA
jgi:hypothetical protein